MGVVKTRDLVLRGVASTFLFAFTSFYVQIPGLYGNKGILPARIQLRSTAATLDGRVRDLQTLVWLGSYLGLNAEYMLDVIALCGIIISLGCILTKKMCISVNFLNMWALYYSLYAVGGTFMWFQWDILLLETGFICIFLAPFFRGTENTFSNEFENSSPSDEVRFWLVRWLLFRLMFSSGVVKLSSHCPTWWGLSALNVHFESQCLPTPLAWYAHHLPNWMLRFSTVMTYAIEIGTPLLFFFPNRCVKGTAFLLQLFLQICIISTGNYNFFNILTIFLCFSLLDDESLGLSQPSQVPWIIVLLRNIVSMFIYSGVISLTIILFGMQYSSKDIIKMEVGFTKASFDLILAKALPVIIYCGFMSLLTHILKALTLTVLNSHKGLFSTMVSLLTTTFYCVAALTLLCLSIVPLSSLHPSTNMTVTPELRKWHSSVSHLHITNSYGLFRRMTGVGGRPEVVIEGSYSLTGPWKEYHFLYKPGNVNSSLPFVVPHQPRLDWQMWFAALGTYHQNPWLMSLTYRLLMGQPEVLKLLNAAKNPFPKKPPTFIRAQLYHYHFTAWSQSRMWWTREHVGEYFPAFSVQNRALIEYLLDLHILPDKDYVLPDNTNKYVKTVLDISRRLFGITSAPVLLWSLSVAAVVILYTKRLFSSHDY